MRPTLKASRSAQSNAWPSCRRSCRQNGASPSCAQSCTLASSELTRHSDALVAQSNALVAQSHALVAQRSEKKRAGGRRLESISVTIPQYEYYYDDTDYDHREYYCSLYRTTNRYHHY